MKHVSGMTARDGETMARMLRTAFLSAETQTAAFALRTRRRPRRNNCEGSPRSHGQKAPTAKRPSKNKVVAGTQY
eukprot:2801790-Rhodomonas_salina.2